MIGAAVTEFELVGGCSNGQRQYLMSETDAKQGANTEKILDGLNAYGNGRRVAWTVAEENAIRVEREDVGGGSRCRNYSYVAPMVGEATQNVALDAVVDGDHAFASPLTAGFRTIIPLILLFSLPCVRGLRCYKRREVESVHRWNCPRTLDEFAYMLFENDYGELASWTGQGRDKSDAFRMTMLYSRVGVAGTET